MTSLGDIEIRFLLLFLLKASALEHHLLSLHRRLTAISLVDMRLLWHHGDLQLAILVIHFNRVMKPLPLALLALVPHRGCHSFEVFSKSQIVHGRLFAFLSSLLVKLDH